MFEEEELVNYDSTNPAKLQQTVWFYISLLFGKRGRENQHAMKKYMLAARETPSGEKYYEMCRELPGAVLATKNHQGGLSDGEDSSDGKIFEKPGSERCPYKIIQNYLSHLNDGCSSLFQKARSIDSKKFNPAKDMTWFCCSPVGHNTIENMLRGMTTRAKIVPHLTNHCLSATAVTVLSAADVQDRHITKVTGHKSVESIRSYSDRLTFEQFRSMSNELANFVEESGPNPTATDENAMDLRPADVNRVGTVPQAAANSNFFLGIQDGQQLLNGLVPGGTFNKCSFQFNINLPSSSGGQ